VLPNQLGRIVDDDLDLPTPHLGVYAVGWAKRGPSGVIGTNKKCAQETVAALLDDLAAGLLSAPVANQESLDQLLSTTHAIDLAGWRAIDEYEKSLGRAQSRPRIKLVSREDMRAAAAGGAS
jgi:ferredoxin--NADP+ reductase